ncbi:hypothetical protein [Nocardioides alkalitolerans]|uniref:hypothetical protein n=1 Tax=Nocardioides alkalitolerans TaxID=281714 RepID=UPI0003F89B71|nr:hypothetical protein [Nocardioides alkalitolerans]
MARHTFGGTLADVATAHVSGFLKPAGPIALSLWSAKVGGAPVTDLLLDGQPVTVVRAGSEGDVPAFEGPDGVTRLWVQVPGRSARRLLAAAGLPGADGLPGVNAVPADQAVGTYLTTDGSAANTALHGAVDDAIDEGMAPGGVILEGVTPIAQAAASDAIANNPNVVTQAGAAAAAAASTAVTIAGVSDGYTAPPATPTVTLGTLNPVAANFAGGRRVLIAVADTHKITQPSVLRSMSGRVANDEAARTIEFYVYRPNGSGGYTVVYRGGAQAAATAGTYTWTPTSYLRLLPGDVPGVWTATNVAANGLYWAGSGGPAIGSVLYQPAVNFPAPAVGDTITPGAGASDPKVQTQYLPALTWTTSHEAVVVASRWANLPGGYPRLDAGGKVPANLLPGARVTGLPMIALGTSVVAIANSYVTQAAAQSGVALDNQAVGSSGIVWDGTRDRSLSATKAELEAAFPGWGGQSYEARIIDRIANIKHLHFAHGYNDRDKPIGTPTSTDRATLYGAYNYVLGKVFEAKPSITVSFETPHSLYTPANEGYHATTAAVRTAILEIGQRYGGPVFDLTQHGQLGQSGATTRTTDGVHPNAAWNAMLAPVLAAWWNEHLPVG